MTLLQKMVEFQPTVADDFLFWCIRAGKAGTAMMDWEGILSDDQIWQGVAFIRMLK